MLSEDKKYYLLPVIESIHNTSNKKLLWQIKVSIYDKNNNIINIKSEYFDDKYKIDEGCYSLIEVDANMLDGKVRKNSPTKITCGKNLGKKNATNLFTQAIKEATSKYNKQLQKTQKINMNEDVSQDKDKLNKKDKDKLNIKDKFNKNEKEEDNEENIDTLDEMLYPPMLAKTMELNKLQWPLCAQTKLNGVRVVSFLKRSTQNSPNTSFMGKGDNEVIMYSRNRKIYKGFSIIKEELEEILKNGEGIYLDGEMYKHEWSLQKISGLCRKNTDTSDKLKLEYHIFDLFCPKFPNMKFTDRYNLLKNFIPIDTKYIKVVQNNIVNNVDETLLLYESKLSENYEGLILRDETPYVYSYNSYHSKNLIKMKPTHDEEFEIVGFTEGTHGKSVGTLMFILKTVTSKIFTVTPKDMSLDERRDLYEKFKSNPDHFNKTFLGKKYTVLFDEYSLDGIPVRARGVAVRDYE